MPNRARDFKASLFQALAHRTRIAIVEELRGRELTAGVLIERLGLEQANVSQHLAVLRSRGILNARKEGNQVFYSVRDPLIHQVLDLMRLYAQAHIEEAAATLREMDSEMVGEAGGGRVEQPVVMEEQAR